MKKSIAVLMSLLMLFALLVPAYAAKSEDLPYPDSRFFDYRDYRIHYRVLKAADERDQILFLHGFGVIAGTVCFSTVAAFQCVAAVECLFTICIFNVPIIAYPDCLQIRAVVEHLVQVACAIARITLEGAEVKCSQAAAPPEHLPHIINLACIEPRAKGNRSEFLAIHKHKSNMCNIGCRQVC